MARDPILITGAAGFIGFHVARRLLADGREVVGVDDLNAYYSPQLKRDRLKELAPFARFRFERGDIADRAFMERLFAAHGFARVVHLAAQAGVRHSLQEPHAYAQTNLSGFLNVLEGCRHHGCGHLLYASSSSVYGANTRTPFRTSDNVDHPLNLYGATKKANELMAHAYSHLFRLPCTGLRFFTVYGPWGRPDMAMWLFTEAIVKKEPVKLFNEGRMKRDFTYIDDAAEAVVRLVDRAPSGDPNWSGADPDPASSSAPWRIYNIGNHRPTALRDFLRAIEEALGRAANVELLPMQPGDAPETFADVGELTAAVGFSPHTPIEAGVKRFVDWFLDYTSRASQDGSERARP